MEKKHIIISAVLIFVISGYFIVGYVESSKSPEIENTHVNSTPKIEVLSASLTGSGSLIDVRYNTDRPLSLDSNNVYLIDHATGEKLRVASTIYIGMLLSRNNKSTYGYFIVNNVDRIVTNGSSVTVVMGDFRQNMTVSEY